MNQNTNPGESCEAIRDQLALLHYGELSFDEEERVEAHLEACGDCRAALDRERALLAAFDQVAVEPSPALLRQSRENLFARLAAEPARPVAAGWWDRLINTITLPTTFLRPAGAVALLALGFAGARLAPSVLPGLGSIGSMGVADSGSARVRYVEPAGEGRVRIVLDETRQRTVSGRMDDDNIRGLLLAATRDPSDPGLRADTVAILTLRAQSSNVAADVKDALVNAVRHDQNAGVRLKAMDGLKAFVHEPQVRTALADVLLTDANPAMRNQAIDLLMQGLDESQVQTVDRTTIGVLQELMSREEKNPYVRQRCQRALELVNASAEIF